MVVDHNEIMRLVGRGKTFAEIARLCGPDVSRSKIAGIVSRWKKRHGVPPTPPRPPAAKLRHAPPIEAARCCAKAVDSLRHGQCRWVHGEPTVGGMSYCDADAMPGRSWCAEHASRVFLAAPLDSKHERQEEQHPPARSV